MPPLTRFQRGAIERGHLHTNDQIIDTETSESWAPGSTPVPILLVSVTLDDDDIKALPETAVTLVEAPGAGKVIIPIIGLCRLQITAGYDAPAEDAALRLLYGGTGNASALLVVPLNGGPFDRTGMLVPLASAEGTYDPEVTSGDTTSSSWVNQALTIKEDWSGGVPFTGGDSSNTITVTVVYAVVDI